MKIKQIPEDFVVEEVTDLKITNKKADYSIIKVTKKNWNTINLATVLSRVLNIKQKFVGFAGNKDRNALTSQYLSLYKVSKERIESIKIKDVEIYFAGYSNERINLGDLQGNKFKIIIRDLTKKLKIPKKICLENYFDEQRFGKNLNNCLIGKAIIKRDLKEACRLIGIKTEKDYIKALRNQPKRLLKLYIGAYQGFLWNKTLVKILSQQKNISLQKTSFGDLIFTKRKMKKFKIQLINFDTSKSRIIDKILTSEGIKREDFITKEMPELITETSEREAFVDVKHIRYKWSKDELNKEKLKVELMFFLPKGVYATMLIKKLSKFLE